MLVRETKHFHEYYMKMALKLSKKGEGAVNPNPLVGAVVVKDGQVLGTGYHKFYGGPHAEVYALEEAGSGAKGADIYVTLEPCSHYGKTPPCAEAIVKAGIKRVIIGAKDPNPLVSGRGIKLLKEKGIEIVTGILEEEARKINEIFIKYITTNRPFTIMKTAMTLDGKIATATGESKWITSEESREYVHKIRNRVMGIMIGVGTAIQDNPLLTTRIKEGNGRNPKAIIVDSTLRIPIDSRILQTIDKREIIVACTKECNQDKEAKLKDMEVKIVKTPQNEDKKVDLKYLIKELGKDGIDSILLEGGGQLNFSALDSGIVDKIMCFIAPKIIGGERAKTPVEGSGVERIKDVISLTNMEYRRIGQDLLIEGKLSSF